LNSLKICDFGLASEVGVGFFDQNDDNAGTMIYQPPEQYKSTQYGKKVDIWSTGMIMYELLTKGGHPILGDDFYNKLERSIEEFRNIMNTISPSEKIVKKNKNYSDLALKLMENLLDVSPKLRYGSTRALKHPWITRDLDSVIPLNMYEEMQLNMKAYEKLKYATRLAFAMSMINHKVLKRELNLELL
jgi:serine/threonine protein kinase